MKKYFYLTIVLLAILTSGSLLAQPTLIADPDVYYCEDEDGVTLAVENSVNGT